MLAMLALDLRDRQRLDRDTLVVTVMSNLGLHQAMAAMHLLDVVRRSGRSLAG